ncbi:MAG: hypothetical protein P4L73_05700 [Caulobacteraceae bacterium]|nr:hypothetical protein [Caulobacteraceae bacterium]
MTHVVSMRPDTYAGARFAEARSFARRAARGSVRVLAVAGGSVLIVAGLVLAVLPGHLGVPLLAVGLILVLRHSPQARRKFIRLQRRHPRFVFPVRRLIRREPEIFPVLWQQVLRFERLVFPSSWRRAALWRRRYLRGRRGG